LPWHDQRMYLELLIEEIDNEDEGGVSSGETVNAAGDLGASGFNVVQVDFGQQTG